MSFWMSWTFRECRPPERKDYLDNLISSEGQCLQGLCFTPDYILMTAYADGSDTKGSLMIFERETEPIWRRLA